jgi:hypothetical protein
MHKKKGSERDCFIFLISFNIARSGWEHKEQNLSSFNLGFLYHKMLQWYKISLFEPNKERIISLSFPSTRENNYFSDHFLPHPSRSLNYPPRLSIITMNYLQSTHMFWQKLHMFLPCTEVSTNSLLRTMASDPNQNGNQTEPERAWDQSSTNKGRKLDEESTNFLINT